MIHPAIVKKAEKLGLIGKELTRADIDGKFGANSEPPAGTVEFHWPSKNVYAYGVGSKPAMAEAEAIMQIAQMDPDWRILNKPGDPFMIQLFNKDRSRVFIREGATPQDTLAELNGDNGDREWLTTSVPVDGAEAYKQGFMAADNPWPEPDTDDPDEENGTKRQEWDDAFDAAADEAANADEAEADAGGSVVKPEYRIRYAEAGHPAHCGDWLAVTLNNLILGKSKTDIEHFEELCNLNGVSLAKYKRVGIGWEGRLRMTGRNLLAGVVYSTGVLKVPVSIQIDGVAEYRAPGEWISTRKFKNKKPAPVVAE